MDLFEKANLFYSELKKKGLPEKISSNEIKGICFDAYGLPQSQSEIYYFLEILTYKGIVKRDLKANYTINYLEFEKNLDQWKKEGRF